MGKDRLTDTRAPTEISAHRIAMATETVTEKTERAHGALESLVGRVSAGRGVVKETMPTSGMFYQEPISCWNNMVR